MTAGSEVATQVTKALLVRLEALPGKEDEQPTIERLDVVAEKQPT